MNSKNRTGWISRKTIKEDKSLDLLLRLTEGGGFHSINISKEDSSYPEAHDTPLETCIAFDDESINIVSESSLPYKFGTIGDHLGLDNLDERSLLIRDPYFVSISSIKENLKISARDYFNQSKFHEVDTSIFTKATEACEDISTLIMVEYDGQELALQQTAQLHLESLVYQFGRVFSLTPSFRNEEASNKHLIEYWHLEGEAVMMNNEDMMDFVEGMIKHIVSKTLNDNQFELNYLDANQDHLKTIQNEPFDRISYTEAIDKLQKKGFKITWGEDLDINAEQLLADKNPTFITHFPWNLKAFYMQRDRNHPELAVCFDLLGHKGKHIHHGEIVGAGERVYTKEDIDAQIKAQEERIAIAGHDPNDYAWYKQLREVGSLPHAGFGIGVERLVKYILDLDHINFASYFPRTRGHYYP